MKQIRGIRTFIAEAQRELRRVEWPTRKETVRLTGIVIGISLLIAAFLGLFDYVFSRILEYILMLANI